MADPLDRAFVEILPDFSKFAQNLRSNLRDATRELETRVDSVLNRLERRFAQFGRDIGDDIGDGMDEATRAARDAADDIEDALDDIDAPDVRVGVDVDQREVDNEVDRAVSGADPPRINIPVDVDREGAFTRFISSITGVRLPIGGFLALGSAVGAAATAAIQLTAALTPSIGIIAGLPSVVGVASAAIGTLQLATNGMGDAFAAAFEDAEKFEEALEGLAPEAQEVARAVREIAPAMTELQQSVQNQFFENMADEIMLAADALLGPLQEGASVAAARMGGLVQRLLLVAASSDGVDFVTSSFETLSGVIANIAGPVEDLFSAFLNLGTAINEAFGGEEAGTGLAAMIQQFADFITAATESGQAVEWVQDAITVFQQLGAIIAPVVDIIGTIGQVASDTGGNILGVFGQGLEAVSEFLASAEGISVVTTLFETFNTIGGAFGDILAGIGPALPPIIDGISALVNAVVPLIAPIAEVAGKIAGALAPILIVLADALEPLIPPLIDIVRIAGGILVQAITALTPYISTLAGIFTTALAPILDIVAITLEALAPIITSVLDAVTPLLVAIQPLLDVFTLLVTELSELLIPIIQFLAEVLLWLVDTIIIPVVVPIIEFLAELFAGLLTNEIQGFATFFQNAINGIVAVFNFLRNVWEVQTAAMIAVWDAVADAFEIGWNLINDNVIKPLRNGFESMGRFIGNVIGDVRSAWNGFVSFITGIPGRISGALRNMFGPLWEGFRSAINNVIDGWNSLSFSVPSVDLGPLGSVGGFEIGTPNIPRLQVGGMSMGEGLAHLDPNEAILPLEDSRTTELLADALGRAVMRIEATQTPAAADGTGGDINVIVKIGERDITDIVDTRIERNNRTLTRRARAGTGRL